MTTIEIPIHDIEVIDRAREDLDVDDLVESIRQVGLLQPIVVRPVGAGYRLVAGERRYRALEQLGEMLVRADVRDLDDADADLVEAVENGMRKAFTPSEAASLGRRLEQRIADDPDFLGKLPTPAPTEKGRATAHVAKAVGLGDRTYRKARKVVDYTARTEDGQQVLDKIEAAMDATGAVDPAARAVEALEAVEDWHADDSTRSIAEEILNDAAWGTGSIEDLHSLRKGKAEAAQRNAQISATPPVAEQVGGADPAEGAIADEHPTTPTSGAEDSGSETHQEPGSAPVVFACRNCGVVLDRADGERVEGNCPRCDKAMWVATHPPVACFDLHGDVLELRTTPALESGSAQAQACATCNLFAYVPESTSHGFLLGACPACSSIDWNPATIGGVQGGPPPSASDDGSTVDEPPALPESVNAALSGEGGSPVPAPAGAVTDGETSPAPPGVEVPSEEEPDPTPGDLHEREPVTEAGSRSTTPDRKREPRKAPPVKRAESEQITALVSELAEAVQALPHDELVRWLATHGDTGGAPGARLRSDLTVLVPWLKEVQLLTAFG